MLKGPKSFLEQIICLKEHGMIISDDKQAMDSLKKVNYYRFTGYALHCRKSLNCSDYNSTADFDAIMKIYQFDEELRALLRLYLERIEIFFRTQIAYGFCINKCCDPPHNQHYDENNFYNKEGYQKVIKRFEQEKEHFSDTLIVKHHDQKYSGEMPLWAMVELISFSNLSMLYNSMYFSEKDMVAQDIGISNAILSNHLHCLSVLRNTCAHAARLYNNEFNPPVRLSSAFLRKFPSVKNNSLFAYIVILLKRLPTYQHKQNLIAEIEKLIRKYGSFIELDHIGFPANYSEIFNKEISYR